MIPNAHFVNIFDTPEEDVVEVMRVVKRLANHYKDRSGIEHVQIISCAGVEAQQDVFHLHVHIVPRNKGDGQDVRWKTHAEWRVKFDELLHQLR